MQCSQSYRYNRSRIHNFQLGRFMKCIFNHISSSNMLRLVRWSHLQAELLRIICTVGMPASYDISYYNNLKYCGVQKPLTKNCRIKHTRTIN
jgi:hypothetical protein